MNFEKGGYDEMFSANVDERMPRRNMRERRLRAPAPGKTHRRWDGYEYRDDGRYAGYVPGAACPKHGGPTLAEVSHQGDPCKFCGTAHDDVAPGPCPALTPNH